MIAPPHDTIERWAWDWLHGPTLASRFRVAEIPDASEPDAPPRVIAAPVRPAELTVIARAERSPSAGALRDPRQRARVLHTFLHHELQAAELMAWAILAFPTAPWAFRRGLAGVLRDEVRHMGIYAEHIEALGHRVGEFPVRDWFWQRVPAVSSPEAFCAVMGVGLEGANLDHSARFAERFRAVGDVRGADAQRHIGEEEIAHVRFGFHWLRRANGSVDFAEWSALLPPPLSPVLMRGDPMNREARGRAGFTNEFLDALAAVTLCERPKTAPAPGC